MIVAAFAAGDRAALRGLLSDDTYRAFEQAIAGREAAGQKQVSAIHGIHSATIESAELKGSVATMAVRFVSDQVSLTQDKEGIRLRARTGSPRSRMSGPSSVTCPRAIRPAPGVRQQRLTPHRSPRQWTRSPTRSGTDVGALG